MCLYVCLCVWSHQNAANSVCGVRVLAVSCPVQGNLALAVRYSDVRVVFDQQLHVFRVVVERTPVQRCLLYTHTHPHANSASKVPIVSSQKSASSELRFPVIQHHRKFFSNCINKFIEHIFPIINWYHGMAEFYNLIFQKVLISRLYIITVFKITGLYRF